MKYTVISGYQGECCSGIHIWAETIPARSAVAAAKEMRKRILKEGNQPGDMVVFDKAAIQKEPQVFSLGTLEE